MQQYNESLIRWKQHKPSQDAGINNIQMPSQPTLMVWQTRDHEPTSYELSLAEHLIRAFSSGAETIDEVVSALNEQGMLHGSGYAFTTESFRQEMARLGH